MKKAKIMLLTIAVLATVGTMLAFKVKKVGSLSICYIEALQEPSPIACTKTLEDCETGRGGSGTQIYYTSTTNLDNCGNLRCSSTANVILD